MRNINRHVILGFSFLLLSTILYVIHYAIFHDAYNLFYYLLMDIAFIPINVLIVTLIIDKLLNERDKRAMLKKLNMVIGAFFSEIGISQLKAFSEFDVNFDQIRKNLLIDDNWTEKDFITVKKQLNEYDYRIDCQKGDLIQLQGFLLGKRDFLLRLLENPNLLEHETFTELLWAVFHLSEELAIRDNVNELAKSDYHHLANDIKRAYVLLIKEWLAYMKHLKEDYPYLYSLAVRTNPFNNIKTEVC